MNNIEAIQKKINALPEPEKTNYQELYDRGRKLNKRCNKIKAIDTKIHETSARIKEIKFEVKHISDGRKVSYGFAGTAVILLTPIWWMMVPVLLCASICGLGSSPAKIAKRDFTAPIALCGKLFAIATRSKEQWQVILEKSQEEKNQLTNKRLELFNDMNAINDKLKQQVIQIVEIGDYKIPELIHDATNLGERVQQISRIRI